MKGIKKNHVPAKRASEMMRNVVQSSAESGEKRRPKFEKCSHLEENMRRENRKQKGKKNQTCNSHNHL